MTTYDDEDFIITVKWVNAEGKEVEQKFYIDEETYECVQEWEYFKIWDKCSLQDTNNHQKEGHQKTNQ